MGRPCISRRYLIKEMAIDLAFEKIFDLFGSWFRSEVSRRTDVVEDLVAHVRSHIWGQMKNAEGAENGP